MLQLTTLPHLFFFEFYNGDYKNAINVWTIRDPLKRKTAKDNGLNWLEFFTIKKFMKWYEIKIKLFM